MTRAEQPGQRKCVEVSVMGQNYTLACPPGSEALMAAAVARVDETMQNIRESGKVHGRDRIALLAAINLTFDTLAAAHAPDSEASLRALLLRLDSALAEDERLDSSPALPENPPATPPEKPLPPPETARAPRPSAERPVAPPNPPQTPETVRGQPLKP